MDTLLDTLPTLKNAAGSKKNIVESSDEESDDSPIIAWTSKPKKETTKTKKEMAKAKKETTKPKNETTKTKKISTRKGKGKGAPNSYGLDLTFLD